MKMRCTEGTNLGDLVDLDLTIQEQEEIDKGARPFFCLDVGDLVDIAQGRGLKGFDDTALVFRVDALRLLSAGICSTYHAETVALWLEGWADDIRKRFCVPGRPLVELPPKSVDKTEVL